MKQITTLIADYGNIKLSKEYNESSKYCNFRNLMLRRKFQRMLQEYRMSQKRRDAKRRNVAEMDYINTQFCNLKRF